jgi:ABC-type sugar transport system permease subunit
VQNPPLWFSDARLAMPSLMIMTLWAAVGGSTMLIFLAGLRPAPAPPAAGSLTPLWFSAKP